MTKLKHTSVAPNKESNSEGGNDEADGIEIAKVSQEHDIWKLLDRLNSKQKRTLSRKLDRLGESVLEEVEKEANQILDSTDNKDKEDTSSSPSKRSLQKSTNDESKDENATQLQRGRSKRLI